MTEQQVKDMHEIAETNRWWFKTVYSRNNYVPTVAEQQFGKAVMLETMDAVDEIIVEFYDEAIDMEQALKEIREATSTAKEYRDLYFEAIERGEHQGREYER